MKYLRILAALVLVGVVAISVYRWRMSGPGPAVVTAPQWTPVTEQKLKHGRFDNLLLYVPHEDPRGFVLLLSGHEGWTPPMKELATRLAEQGAVVAGLDGAQLDANLEADAAQCVFPDGDLENLSHFLQAYLRLPSYLSPILAGYATGGTLAYATLVQAPQNTFAGAVSVQFCPSYPLNKPLCKGSGIEFNVRPTEGSGVEFRPSKQAGLSWTVLESADDAACPLSAVKDFVAEVPGARIVMLPTGTHEPLYSPAVQSAFDALMTAHPSAAVTDVPTALADLPIVTVPAQSTATTTDTFAILLSGDGGWAGLDKEVAGALAANGIPVIGLDSLRYFWSARTPAGLAADLDRMTQYYLGALGKKHVMLIGYSQGADVLPFAVNKMKPETRSHVTLAAVMGLSEHALFEFHMSSWVSDDDSGPATLPEVDRITGIPVLCIYGEGESDTLCPKLDPRKATVVKLKGGHHFDGDYEALAKAILAAAHP